MEYGVRNVQTDKKSTVILIAVGMRTKLTCCFSCYFTLVTRKVAILQYSIGTATEQSFRYIELSDAKIWISINASLCRVLANRVTIVQYFLYTMNNT